MELLKGKTAIVTGGTRGIGFAIVKAFLDNGAKVALCGSREGTASAAVEKLKTINPDYEVMGIWPDMTDPNSIAAEFAKVNEAFGRIDILGNNAGVSARESLYDYDPAAFDKTWRSTSMPCSTAARQLHLSCAPRAAVPLSTQALWSASTVSLQAVPTLHPSLR